jgi:hypothetical protein
MEVILFAGWYSPALCQRHPDKTFVFGDNTQRFGMGGQAVIRNEPNALGVATKRKPAMTEAAFFKEGVEADIDNVLADLAKVWAQLKDGGTVVIPVTTDGKVSLGLDRAQLRERAPSVYKTIEMHVEEMVANYGSRRVGAADGL